MNEAEELCFFPVDNRRRGRQSVDILRAKVDETASDAQRGWCDDRFPGPPMSNSAL